MPRVSKAKAKAEKRARGANARAVGKLLAGFTGSDASDYIRALIRDEGERLKSKSAQLTNEQRSMVLVRLSGLAEKLAKLTGEGRVIDERAILRSQAGKRLVDLVADTLRPWPEACLALAAALESIE